MADLGDVLLVAPTSTKPQRPGTYLPLPGAACGLSRNCNLVLSERRLIDKKDTLKVGRCPDFMAKRINAWLGVLT